MEKITKFQIRFNECLKDLHIKQTDLAAAAKVSKQCISDYKAGKSVPSIDTLYLICRYLDVSSDYLLGLNDSI
ncbi:MAG: helix-turn-helix domain-containing protein [Clostridiales bacterium]|nr:helix-turn-helix domain-containing protein [Clostridiales bacterium]